MSNILVPVDFSDNCHNAYAYALELAAKTRKNVILAHYFETIGACKQQLSTAEQTRSVALLNRLIAFRKPKIACPALELPEGTTISWEVKGVCSVSGAILNRARESDVGCIVMATRSTAGLKSKWLGTNANIVSESAPRPVFLIPPGSFYRSLRRVVAVNHFENDSSFNLDSIAVLRPFSKTSVYPVHVVNSNRITHKAFLPWTGLTASTGLNIAPPPARAVDQGLLLFADRIDADLTLIINRNRAHWRSLFCLGTHQQMTRVVNRPLLIVHVSEVIPDLPAKKAVSTPIRRSSAQ